MTIIKGLPSNLNLSNTDDKNLEFLIKAFGSMISPEDMASAYSQAGYDVHKASEILYTMLGSSSQSDTHVPTDGFTRAPAPSVGATVGKVSGTNGAGLARPRGLTNEPATAHSRYKPRTSGATLGTVSGIIGADYGRIKAKTNRTGETTKPVKLFSNEIPASQIWVEKPQTVKNVPTETVNADTVSFLYEMLGDGFNLDIDDIRGVLGGCGYDVQETMERLMNMSAPNVDLGSGTSSSVDQTSTDAHEDLSVNFEENVQLSDPSRRLNLQKEILTNLFHGPEISEVAPETVRPKRQPRTRKYGLVTAPLEDTTVELKTPIVKKEVNENGNEEVEDNYETLREATMEHWITMKQYYRAAADAYAKGDDERSHRLVEQGHCYMAKASEADEKSTKLLTQNSDDGEAISINLNDYDPKDAIHLLKTQLKSMSGIPSIHYLKVMVGANDVKNKRKRLIRKLLERDAINWTEEEDGQVMSIRIDVINPKRLSFNKQG
ncbi:putative nuclear RNA export factor SDE5 [Bidens hawaiensis]|uniref:putative nuclear RNA export factor SDE5 n=1 Tax=Bidens hawaiensis TaxID=980011 RepID=UPI00404A7C0C